MILRLTVQDAAASICRDIEVVAAPDSSVGSLLDSLPVPVGGRACFVGAVELERRATLADSPLTPGSVISVGAPGPVFRPGPGDSVGVLTVIEGPDAGLAVALAPGTHAVARDSRAAVCLQDPDVSRQGDAWLEISRDGDAVIVDRGSTNGTFVDGAKVTGRTVLEPDSVVEVGCDELQWTPVPAGALRTTRVADGRLDFDRAFAAAPVLPRSEVALPTPPADPQTSNARALYAMLPVVGGIAMLLVTGRPVWVLMTVLGAVAYFVLDSDEDRQRKKSEAALAASVESFQTKIDSQIAEEWRVRLLLAPCPSEIAETAAGAWGDLWPRRTDSSNGLVLRVGVADQPASVDLRGADPWGDFCIPMVPVGLNRFDGHPRSGVLPREDVHHGEHGEEEASASPFVHAGVQGRDRGAVPAR